MSEKLRFVVVDGYAKAGREELAAGGASSGGQLYARMLKALVPGCRVDVVHPADPGESLPTGAALADYDGVAWSGSSLTVYHDTPEVRAQIEFAREAYRAGVPQFGSCWAAQIAVVAAGGACARNPRGREFFIARKIRLTAAGRGHPMYEGKKSVFDGWISHDDEITHLPPNAVRLAGNDFTHVQAVAVTHEGGLFWAVQYHPEYDVHEMARLAFCRRQKLVELGFLPDMAAADAFVNDLEALHADPSNAALRFRFAIDEDILNPDVRQAEVRNWISRAVRPRRLARA